MNKKMSAAEILHSEGVSCVVVNEPLVLMSKERGIKPILKFLCDNPDCMMGAVVADKVVGKAAALLFIYGGVRAIYADVLSIPAEEVLKKYNIQYEAELITKRIKNRTGDGLCPMESRAMTINTPEEAYKEFKGEFENAIQKA